LLNYDFTDNSGLECEVCKYVMQYLDKKLGENRTEVNFSLICTICRFIYCC